MRKSCIRWTGAMLLFIFGALSFAHAQGSTQLSSQDGSKEVAKVKRDPAKAIANAQAPAATATYVIALPGLTAAQFSYLEEFATDESVVSLQPSAGSVTIEMKYPEVMTQEKTKMELENWLDYRAKSPVDMKAETVIVSGPNHNSNDASWSNGAFTVQPTGDAQLDADNYSNAKQQWIDSNKAKYDAMQEMNNPNRVKEERERELKNSNQ